MSEVVSFAKAKEKREPHLSGEAICIGCRHEWVAVAPVGVWQLECPSCLLLKGVFSHPVGAAEGDALFVCDCGCEALTAYFRDRLFYLKCMNCGVDHSAAVFGE